MVSTPDTIDQGSPSPTRAPLSRQRIVSAALELADTRGDFSMRALGERLGVDPMAIYRHFTDKQALLDALVDAALAGLHPAPPQAGPPAERVRRLCVDFRSALSAHPGAAARIREAVPTLGPHVVTLTEAALGLLIELGIDAGEASRAFTMLVGFVTAQVEDEQRILAEFGTEQAWREAVQARYASLSGDEYPAIRAMATRLDDACFDDDFERGLDLLIDAICRRGPAPAPTA